MRRGKRNHSNYETADLIDRLKAASPEHQERVIRSLPFERMLSLDADFECWAHDQQLPPSSEGWRTWLMLAGRGFGKTRAGAEWIFKLASHRPKLRIALVGGTIAEARSIMVEGVSGLLSIGHRRRRRVKWEPSQGLIKWPNGSEAKLFSGDHADGLRGPEHDFAWFLTFEILADAAPPTLAGILGDASGAAIVCDDERTVGGYAAYGKSISSAVEPLVTTYAVELFDDGDVLRGVSADASIEDSELGNAADGEPAPRIQREQLPARAVPAALRLAYYDAARDYQSGEARVAASEEPGRENQRELPAVLAAGEAKALVQQVLARSWAERDRLTLRLPPNRLGLEPGTKVSLNLSPRRWTVTKCTIEGMVVIAELRPATGAAVELVSESGRILANSDMIEGEVTLAVIDAASLSDTATEPTVLVAASSATPGWRAKPVEARYGGQRIVAQTSRRKAVIGAADNVLPAADPAVVDVTSMLDVTLVDPDQWLLNCDDAALDEGANLAMVGKELIQFGQADPIGPGQFRLSRLRRGLRGTDVAVADHDPDEQFLLIEADALKPITLPPWARGYQVSVVCGERSAEVTLPSKAVPEAIANPSGGATADSEARAAIAQMLDAMREQGLIAS
jgi:hypothetical protein